MRTFTHWYWPLWLVLGFGVPELIALIRHRSQDTFSGWVWRFFDILPGRTVWQFAAGQFFVFGFMVWLTGHLAFHWWAGRPQ